MAKTTAEALSITAEGNVLVIRIPMTAPVPSASGKTKVVASTHGNIPTTVEVQGKPVVVGVNAYIRA